MNNTKYLPGMLDDIGFVVIFTQFEGKWVLCWHKRRESWENPGGHVEPGETALQAAKRELYEETGITDFDIIPLWDYVQIWDDGIHQNNGRCYLANAHSLGTLPKSEMGKIGLFETVPENFTYNREEALKDYEATEKILKAYKE